MPNTNDMSSVTPDADLDLTKAGIMAYGKMLALELEKATGIKVNPKPTSVGKKRIDLEDL